MQMYLWLIFFRKTLYTDQDSDKADDGRKGNINDHSFC